MAIGQHFEDEIFYDFRSTLFFCGSESEKFLRIPHLRAGRPLVGHRAAGACTRIWTLSDRDFIPSTSNFLYYFFFSALFTSSRNSLFSASLFCFARISHEILLLVLPRLSRSLWSQ
jgi:hypothetical protein